MTCYTTACRISFVPAAVLTSFLVRRGSDFQNAWLRRSHRRHFDCTIEQSVDCVGPGCRGLALLRWIIADLHSALLCLGLTKTTHALKHSYRGKHYKPCTRPFRAALSFASKFGVATTFSHGGCPRDPSGESFGSRPA